MAAKIILLDIEVTPNLGWTWGKYDQDVIAFERISYILSFAWKELGGNAIHTHGLDDYRVYDRDDQLVRDLWRTLDSADIVVAHNGDVHDFRKANARFISHGLPPPSPYKTIDTLKVAKKYFKFESNKLNDLGQYLEIGEKLPTPGFKLWKGCMDGDPKSWERMKEYNAQDVRLLEEVYLKLRPWIDSHPHLGMYGDSPDTTVCPNCGSSHVQRRGVAYAITQTRQRFQCQSCRTWFSGEIIRAPKAPTKHVREKASGQDDPANEGDTDIPREGPPRERVQAGESEG